MQKLFNKSSKLILLSLFLVSISILFVNASTYDDCNVYGNCFSTSTTTYALPFDCGAGNCVQSTIGGYTCVACGGGSPITNYWTTDSDQYGLTGNKETSGYILASSFTARDNINDIPQINFLDSNGNGRASIIADSSGNLVFSSTANINNFQGGSLISINNIDAVGYGSFDNVYANNICYTNGTGCPSLSGGNSSWNQSLADSLYYPLITNPNNYYNLTTAPTYKNDTWGGNQSLYYNKTTIDNNLSLYYLKTNPNNYVNITSIVNTTIARNGTFNCPSGQILVNVTTNSSGVFGQCILQSSLINYNYIVFSNQSNDMNNNSLTNVSSITFGNPSSSTTTTYYGNCINISGNGYLNIGTSKIPSGSANESVFLWVRTKTTTDYANIMEHGQSLTNQLRSLDIRTNGNLLFTGYNNDCTASVVVNDGNWHYVGYVYRGGNNLTLWFDNTAYPCPALNTFNTINVYFHMGWDTHNSAFMTGSFDDTAIWNRTLENAEINSNWNGGLGNYTLYNTTGLVLFYHYDNTTGESTTSIKDYANNNNATVTTNPAVYSIGKVFFNSTTVISQGNSQTISRTNGMLQMNGSINATNIWDTTSLQQNLSGYKQGNYQLDTTGICYLGNTNIYGNGNNPTINLYDSTGFSQYGSISSFGTSLIFFSANNKYSYSNGEIWGLDNITVTKKITLTNASTYSGYVVCYATGGVLGHCTSIVGVGGTCTCVVN